MMPPLLHHAMGRDRFFYEVGQLCETHSSRMSEMMAKLTPQELADANRLGAAVGSTRKSVETAVNNLTNAAGAGIDQQSGRWATLCSNLEQAWVAHVLAVDKELQWWRSKGFNIS